MEKSSHTTGNNFFFSPSSSEKESSENNNSTMNPDSTKDRIITTAGGCRAQADQGNHPCNRCSKCSRS